MIRPIQKDIFFLRKKAEPATKADISVADNMIGVNKSIIAFDSDGVYMEMFNPKIVSHFGEYETEESCLSLTGKRKTKRFQIITVHYQTRQFKEKQDTFMGFTAEIIQHEMDHLSGIII